MSEGTKEEGYPSEDRLVTCLVWGVSVSVVLVSFRAVGKFDLREHTPILLVDGVWAVLAPFLTYLILANYKKALKQPVVVAVGLFCLLAVVSELFGRGSVSVRAVGRYVVMAVTITGIAILGDMGFRRKIAWWFFGGVVSACCVSVVGYLIVSATGGMEEGVNPFVFVSQHPTFDGWPRLSGTYGHSPQHFGELLFAGLAVGLALKCRGKKLSEKVFLASILVLACGLVLTFSISWLGGGILLCGLFLWRIEKHRRLMGVAVVFGCLVASLGMTWLVTFGLPGQVVGGGE